MDDLPDEMIVAVLSKVELQDLLLSVRHVSSRFRYLACHHNVWCHRALTDNVINEREARLTTLALQVAPSLRQLEVVGTKLGHLREATATSSCATLEMDMVLNGDVAHEERVLRNIISGRLRRLKLEFLANIPLTNRVLEIVLPLNLVRLHVIIGGRFSLCWLPLPTLLSNAGSIKQLVYEGCHSDGLLEFLVMKLSKSVQLFELNDPFNSFGFSLPIMGLLPSCKQLTDVKVPISLQVEDLLNVEGLKNLTLLSYYHSASEEFGEVQAGVQRFFKRVAGLQCLTFHSLTEHEEEEFEFVLNAVDALQSNRSSSSTLLLLSVDFVRNESFVRVLEEKLTNFPLRPQLITK